MREYSQGSYIVYVLSSIPSDLNNNDLLSKAMKLLEINADINMDQWIFKFVGIYGKGGGQMISELSNEEI